MLNITGNIGRAPAFKAVIANKKEFDKKFPEISKRAKKNYENVDTEIFGKLNMTDGKFHLLTYTDKSYPLDGEYVITSKNPNKAEAIVIEENFHNAISQIHKVPSTYVSTSYIKEKD